MNSPEPTSDNRKDPEIAAAELLFQDAEPPASTRPVGPVIATGSSEGFELADVSEHSASPPPSSQSAPSREAASGKPADSRPRARMVAPVAPAVEQVWSRGSEWGSTFVVLACWIAAILGIAYFTLGAELYGTDGIDPLGRRLGRRRPQLSDPDHARAAGADHARASGSRLLRCLVASSPPLPSDVALAQRQGRISPQFASYEGFKAYWIARLGQLHEGHAGRFSPLVFQVEEFHAEKSAGKTEIDARFRVRVLVEAAAARGRYGACSSSEALSAGPMACGISTKELWPSERLPRENHAEVPADAASQPESPAFHHRHRNAR